MAPPEPLTASDERGHEPDSSDPLWNESWYLDFVAGDGGLGGYVRVGLYPALGVAWYWGCLVGEGRPLVAVVDHEVPLPVGPALGLRTTGLWADHTVEVPFEHFTVGLEAFGVAIDDPADADAAPGDLRGERLALGFDLEWETEAGVYPYPGLTRYEIPCRVHGRVLVGDETIDVDGHGERDHSWGHRDWWAFPWCWTAGRLDDGTWFHASRPEINGVTYEPGFVARPGAALEPASGFSVETVPGDGGLPERARATLHDLTIEITPRWFAPVRLEAPDGRVGRLARALCRVDTTDGRSGHGWTEWNQPHLRS